MTPLRPTTFVLTFGSSISNGHDIIQDMARSQDWTQSRSSLAPFVEDLERFPFVEAIDVLEQEPRGGSGRFDHLIQIKTLDDACLYWVEVKRSYLDSAITRSIAAQAKRLAQENRRLLLLARYLPRPTAQQLLENNVEFMDLAGNVHLNPTLNCHWTVIGKREPREKAKRPTNTAATLQVLFTIAARPESAALTVRELAAAAGVSKSKAASTRRDLLEQGTIRAVGGRFRPLNPQELTDQLVFGYRQTLRPRLVIGRYRPPEDSIQDFLVRLKEDAQANSLRYSLTGGPAAHRLQGFYHGVDAPIFIRSHTPNLLKRLRLLPDREGPVTLLRAFGDPPFWRKIEGTEIAHPWLIYAELLDDPNPRAHEAAEELQEELLSP